MQRSWQRRECHSWFCFMIQMIQRRSKTTKQWWNRNWLQKSVRKWNTSSDRVKINGLTNFAISENINFLIADGKRFAHPLEHLNKRLEDLPVIAIDSFRHMYLFPDFKLMFKPGRLKKFVADLHSGKLHREFHYGPEDETEEENEISDHADEHKSEHKSEHEPEHTPEHKSEHESEPKSKPKSEHRTERAKISSENEIDDDGSPPDSTFVKLAPSEKRYTLLRNEL